MIIENELSDFLCLDILSQRCSKPEGGRFGIVKYEEPCIQACPLLKLILRLPCALVMINLASAAKMRLGLSTPI